MTAQGCVAFDLGAESGRAVLAAFDGSKITLQEVHRFANGPQRLPQGYHWNILELWANLQAGLRRAAAQARQEELELAHLGVDTWGVDYALVGRSGQILGLPWAYRDPRHAVGMQQALEQVGAKALYEATGVQFLPFNTLFQLLALRQAEPGLLDQARRLLFIPDLLHYFFTGQRVNEATIASTSQMIDPRSGAWHAKLLQDLGLPTHFLEEAIVPAGTRIGPLRPEVAQEAGVGAMEVIAPGSHDTASAVAAVPVDASATPRWAYLSSGTWSLMGVEREAPLLSDAAREANFTNERGVCGKIRFLKNIAGLWLVQEVRRDLAQQGQELDYPQLTRLAEQAPPFATLVNPDHAPFVTPGGILAKIDAFADATGQPCPATPGQYVRCCLESLALIYRITLDKLQALLDQQVDVLHIVGGGGKNELLNQMTADATGRQVVVGPYEATAIGNALTQFMGRGRIHGLDQLRAVVRASFPLQTYTPRNTAAYEEQLPRFRALLGQ